MGDETEVTKGPESSGVSRRNALKAGVAVGVGAAAWSGVSITSLGGTPAYAAGCTFAIFVDLTDNGGCRNTDQGNSGACGQKPPPQNLYGYHPLKSALPTGFSIAQNIAEGTCCSDVPPAPNAPQFNFPSNLKCIVYLEFSNASDGKCSANPFIRVAYGDGTSTCDGIANCTSPPVVPADTGPIDIDLRCYAGVQSNTFYRIYAKCIGDNNPPSCLAPG